jgi:hypothetical protein
LPVVPDVPPLWAGSVVVVVESVVDPVVPVVDPVVLVPVSSCFSSQAVSAKPPTRASTVAIDLMGMLIREPPS